MEPSENHTRHHQHRQHAKSVTPIEAPFSYRFAGHNYSNYFLRKKKSHKCVITYDDFALYGTQLLALYSILAKCLHQRLYLAARLEIRFISSIMISIKFMIRFRFAYNLQGSIGRCTLVHGNNSKDKLKLCIKQLQSLENLLNLKK